MPDPITSAFTARSTALEVVAGLDLHGFLHAGHGQWQLAPAFDLNPFPDKDRELKTWLTEESGPTGSIDEALGAAAQPSSRPSSTKPWRGRAVC